jgi:hypothetical protein
MPPWWLVGQEMVKGGAKSIDVTACVCIAVSPPYCSEGVERCPRHLRMVMVRLTQAGSS